MSDKAKIGCLLVTVAVLIGLAFLPVFWTDTVEGVVIGKTVQRSSSEGGDNYLIATKSETMQVVDTWVYWNFNSSDDYMLITEGKKYRFSVYGFRIPFLSMYRGIYAYEELSE